MHAGSGCWWMIGRIYGRIRRGLVAGTGSSSCYVANHNGYAWPTAVKTRKDVFRACLKIRELEHMVLMCCRAAMCPSTPLVRHYNDISH